MGKHIVQFQTRLGYFYSSYEGNPTQINGKITLTATLLRISEWVDFNVLFKSKKKIMIEYVAYEPVINVRPPPYYPKSGESEGADDDDDRDSSSFIIIGEF